MKMPPAVSRQRPNGYECETVRARSQQLVKRLMDGLCGCCGLPNTRESVWCRQCEGHVRTSGKVCERAYGVATGRLCPLIRRSARRNPVTRAA